MKKEQISFASFNLFNLNEPELPIYSNKKGWDEASYKKKIKWTADNISHMRADIFGFQELWHKNSLQAAFHKSGLEKEYDILVPSEHSGQGIICAGAIKKGLLAGSAEWISDFPEDYKLLSHGDDPQTAQISVQINRFSRPVLHFQILPHSNHDPVHVFVCHFKSKSATRIFHEDWYENDKDKYKDHREALGSALSTIRRTAEATALRIILTKLTKKTDTPVVVLGDINDGVHSNTMNILSGQPNYLTSLSFGGSLSDLYTVQTLQNYRSQRDVYYTYDYNRRRESLDHILVSQEFYDNSYKRIWAFDKLVIVNDHLNDKNHLQSGTNDHGIIKATFKYNPT